MVVVYDNISISFIFVDLIDNSLANSVMLALSVNLYVVHRPFVCCHSKSDVMPANLFFSAVV